MSNVPERVWITWDDAYPWTTPETGGIPYVLLDHSPTGSQLELWGEFLKWRNHISTNEKHGDTCKGCAEVRALIDRMAHVPVVSPTGKVSEGDEARALVDAFRYASPPVQSLRFLEWEPLVESIAAALAAVRKEEREAAKRVVTDTLPAVNFGNGEYLRREILKALEAAANGKG